MSRKRIDPELAELIRRGARTALAARSGIIIDRNRIQRLISDRKTQSLNGATPQSTVTLTNTAGSNRMNSFFDESQTLTTIPSTMSITGMVIGGSQKATYKSLDKHYADICECQKCPLGATRTKFVYGVGNPGADIMFIGEAPGKNEDEQGEPFVGRAGQLLDKILGAIQLSRDEVYIANILKCRPPGNRDPQPAEMEQCFPYLKEQIAVIKPKLLCALGRIAAQALLQTTTPIGKLRGMWHSYQGTPLLVTYHPAALLRNPAFKRGTWEDVQILRAEYDKILKKS